MGKYPFTRDVLTIDPEREVRKITNGLRSIVSREFRRRGLVVALSGGIDSSVTTALAARALGPERVLGLLMPERHSAEETLGLSTLVADTFGIPRILEDITDILDAVGFYRRYDAAVRLMVPEYDQGWKSKIVITGPNDRGGFHLFSIVAQSPEGIERKARLSLRAYLEIVAATNFKQRTRKMLEYYHADRLNYAVAGTPNRLEYDQGFFVKLGDGAADIKPIAHLYKSQVYQLAACLGVPEEVRKRSPTTDTYSLPQGQDEFYFSLPYDRMDLCLFGKNNGYAAEEVAESVALTPGQVQRVYNDIDTKRATTRYLHQHGKLIEDVPEIKWA